MNKFDQFLIKTPFEIFLEAKTINDNIVQISYTQNNTQNSKNKPISKLAKETNSQFIEYFKNPKYKFDLPLKYSGTTFQEKVWRALLKLAPGKTITYSELATLLNTGARAIGNACRTNPITIIIPCHRVIAKNNRGGYCGNITGPFLVIKNWLLQHETC